MSTQVIGVVAPDITVDEELVNRWIIGAEAQALPVRARREQIGPAGFAAFLARLRPFAELGYAVVPLSAQRTIWRRSCRCSRGERTVPHRPVRNGQDDDPERRRAARAGEDRARYRKRFRPAGTRRRSPRSIRSPSDGGGWIVDSPGLKVFGLAHVEPETIADAFVEIRPLLGHCRFRDCRHDREPGCAVWQRASTRARSRPHRVALMQRLVRESKACARAGAVAPATRPRACTDVSLAGTAGSSGLHAVYAAAPLIFAGARNTRLVYGCARGFDTR